MKEEKFFKHFILITLLLMFGVAGFNFCVDPGNFYLNRILLEKHKNEVYHIFSKSEEGVVWSGDERIFAYILLSNLKEVDCLVLGSSRAMQISWSRGGYVRKHCSTILNVSVSGASLEDYFIFSQVLEKVHPRVRKIFLEIPPWLFKYNMDKRYQILINELEQFRGKSEKLLYVKLRYYWNLAKNLFSLEMLQKSWKKWRKNDYSFPSPLFMVRPTNWNVQELEGSKLKDGSHLYSREYRNKMKTDKFYFKKPNYKIGGASFELPAIEEFKKFVLGLQQKSEVVLLKIPYHPNSFSRKYNFEKSVFEEVSFKVMELSKNLGVLVMGEYDPTSIPCNYDEFFDFMHPHSTCVDKLFK